MPHGYQPVDCAYRRRRFGVVSVWSGGNYVLSTKYHQTTDVVRVTSWCCGGSSLYSYVTIYAVVGSICEGLALFKSIIMFTDLLAREHWLRRQAFLRSVSVLSLAKYSRV